MVSIKRWPFAIFAFLLVWLGVFTDIGTQRGGWLSNLFAPIPFRDVQVVYLDDIEVRLTYIPSECELGSIAAFSTISDKSRQVPVYEYMSETIEDRVHLSIDTDLIGFSYDTLEVIGRFDCGKSVDTRVLALVENGQVGSGHPNYVGPEGGYK